MRIARLFCTNAIVIFATLGVSAQVPAAASGGPPKFSSRAELVLVPVIVHSHGKPVTGLTKEQFILLDDGKQRTLALFEETTNAQKPVAPNSGGKNEFRNYVPTKQSAGRVTIILIDLLNTPLQEQENARREVIRYLDSQLSPDEPTALLVLSLQGLFQVHSFTTDTKILKAAVRTLSARARSPEFSSSPAPRFGRENMTGKAVENTVSGAFAAEEARIAEALEKAMNGMQAQAQKAYTLNTLQAFEYIARGYAGIPGRKSLVWISAGFPNRIYDPTDLTVSSYDWDPRLRNTMLEFYEPVWKLLNAANVAVYPVDAMGLVAGPDVRLTSPGEDAGMPDPRAQPGALTGLVVDTRGNVRDTFKAFASETGGKTCMNQNDLAKCLERAAEDSVSYYMLGFYVSGKERKPGWHKLRIKLKAKHSDVRHREHYYIGKTELEDVLQRKSTASIAAAAHSPVDYTAMPVEVVITGVRSVADRRNISFEVNLPPASFAIDEAEDNRSALRISVIALDQNQKQVAIREKTLYGNLKPETAKLLSDQGLTHKDEIELPQGRYELKFIVRDDITGKMGSVTVQIDK